MAARQIFNYGRLPQENLPTRNLAAIQMCLTPAAWL